MKRDLFLDGELLLLECLNFRTVGRWSVHFIAQSTVEPFVLLLEGVDVRSFHEAVSLTVGAGKSPARVVTQHGRLPFDSRDSSHRAIVMKPQYS